MRLVMNKLAEEVLAVLADLDGLCLDNDRERRIVARHVAAALQLSEEGQRLLIRFDTIDPMPRNELEELVRHLRKGLRV